jgi:hypothetical protein
MLSGLPSWAGAHWFVLVIKALAAFGFICAANLVILYAC